MLEGCGDDLGLYRSTIRGGTVPDLKRDSFGSQTYGKDSIEHSFQLVGCEVKP